MTSDTRDQWSIALYEAVDAPPLDLGTSPSTLAQCQEAAQTHASGRGYPGPYDWTPAAVDKWYMPTAVGTYVIERHPDSATA